MMISPSEDAMTDATQDTAPDYFICDHGHKGGCTQCLRDSGHEVQRSKLICYFGELPVILQVEGGSIVDDYLESQGCYLEDWLLDEDAPRRSDNIQVWEGDVWWDHPSPMDGEADIHFDEGVWRVPSTAEVLLVAGTTVAAQVQKLRTDRDNAISLARELGADVADLESCPPELTVTGDLTLTARPSLELKARLDAALTTATKLRTALVTEQGAWETAAKYLADFRKTGSEMSLAAIFEMIDGGNPRLTTLLTETDPGAQTEANGEG